MQHTEEYVQPQGERLKSFDALASIDMYQFDLERFGRILPETRQRVYDEELTYIAEGINRPVQTAFNLQEQNQQLVYFDRGGWRPYIGTLMTGLETAKQEAAQDSRKQFLVGKAEIDLQMGYAMNRLRPGQQLAWYSAYPKREAGLYGTKFINECGFQSEREMGFLYLAQCEADGSLTLYSQSVDNSYEVAFQAAYMLAQDGHTDIDAMRAMYDRVLGRKYGAEFYAGRDKMTEITPENAWEAIRWHKDLLGFYFESLEQLAGQPLPRGELETAKKRLTYGVWAALKERLDTSSLKTDLNFLQAIPEAISHEITAAYQRLSVRGEVLFGCGGAIKGEDALMSASGDEVFDAVFGGKNQGKESWAWGKGICRVDGCPTRPGKTKVGPCKVCVCCQNIFDKGKDPAAEYKLRRSRAAYN